MESSEIPVAYRRGYEEAARFDADLAARYVRHTTIGDPAADAAVAALQEFGREQAEAWIRAGIEQGPGALADAPAAVRSFFTEAEQVPDWFDPKGVGPGCRGFHRNSEMILGAFVAAVLIEGFCTLISQSFAITGRIVDQGVRRLKQNNRHILEIFMPGGLDRQGDGWKLSVRIRLVHAGVRKLLAKSEEWDAASWGTPLSAAHLAYANTAFSALLLKRAAMLGVGLSEEERQSFMMIWRYAGHLLGVPPELLFENEEQALRLQRVGALCEPPPTMESIILANAMINSAPIVVGFDTPRERRALARRIYRVSRAMVGDELADQLHFPKQNVFGAIATLRWRNRLESQLSRWIPALDRRRSSGLFQMMLNVSHYSAGGIGYRLPGHVHAEKDQPL